MSTKGDRSIYTNFNTGSTYTDTQTVHNFLYTLDQQSEANVFNFLLKQPQSTANCRFAAEKTATSQYAVQYWPQS